MDVVNGRRVRKVSRACDSCKVKKARCSGTKPCNTCARKGLPCQYEALYLRGKPPTPAPSASTPRTAFLEPSLPLPEPTQCIARPGLSSRNSPELGTADVDGQFVDSTSGFSFLHRARKRVLRLRHQTTPDVRAEDVNEQPWIAAGDNALLGEASAFIIPTPIDSAKLIDVYFQVCAPTYRFLHRPTFEAWLETIRENQHRDLHLATGLSKAKLAIVLSVFGIAHVHLRQTDESSPLFADPLLQGDSLIRQAVSMTDSETGIPSLSSVQARLAETFYFCMTSRFNRAWYIFGSCLQMISALGLHRRSAARHSVRTANYIKQESVKRTFWTAYILDKYLGVVFGRPPHFHDYDIDQEYPDRVNDEDMTADGPHFDDFNDCNLDAFVFNARLARIVGDISQQVYPIQPTSEQERLAAVDLLSKRIDEWHSQLPPFLKDVKPTSLVRTLRRQSTALNIAHCHAIMHLYRPLLLGGSNTPAGQQLESSFRRHGIDRCISAAHHALRLVDDMARQASIFDAYWWTHYVTFCALAVVYVWRLQKSRLSVNGNPQTDQQLFELAERCHKHLAEATRANAPSRRYSVILEELRIGASERGRASQEQTSNYNGPSIQEAGDDSDFNRPTIVDATADSRTDDYNNEPPSIPDWLDDWDTSNWLDLDASVRHSHF